MFFWLVLQAIVFSGVDTLRRVALISAVPLLLLTRVHKKQDIGPDLYGAEMFVKYWQ